MKTKVSPAIVGLFVIGAFALAIISLLTFGGVNFFAKPQRFVVYFDESVHGLTLGSPVKLSGVQIGRVVDLSVRYNQQSNHSAVAVVCEFSKDKVTDAKGNAINVAERTELQTLVDRGLRAQLGVQGLATGLLFVELDFKNPKDYPADLPIAESKYLAVPSVPSAISEFQNNLTDILNDIKKIDFAGIGRGVDQLLADTHRQLDGIDLKGLVAQWQKTGASVDALVNAPEIKATIVHLDDAVVELRVTLANLNTQVDSGGAHLQSTLKEAQDALKAFNDASAAARHFIEGQRGLGDDVSRALRQVSEASAAVQQLVDLIERNPNALLVGKRKPE
ncbi:MAG TPA: MlaD family protein [Opitutaceae bacterium]|nr:MlaD family protein [Opitutaceae bacterium]